MSNSVDTPYLDASSTFYKKAEDNFYFTTEIFGDYRDPTRPSNPTIPWPNPRRTSGSASNSRRSHSTGERGSSHDRDIHVWVGARGIQSNDRNDRNSRPDYRVDIRDSRTSQSVQSNGRRTSQSNRRNDNGNNQSVNNNPRPATTQVIPRGLSRDINDHTRNTPNNNTSNSRNTARTIAETSHNAPQSASITRARTFSESANLHSRPRPRNTRALVHQSHSMGDDGPVVVTQPLPLARLDSPSQDSPLTPSRDSLPTPKSDNPSLPRRDFLPSPSRDSLPTPGRDNPPTLGRDILPTPRGEYLPTTSSENNRSFARENKCTSSSSRSSTGITAEGIDSNMNQIKHRNAKPPLIRIDNHHIDTEDTRPPASPRIRQLIEEADTTRNPMLGDCPRPHSLDTEPCKKSKAKRSISAPELRQMNCGEPCFERIRTCADDNRELRVEHEPRSNSCNSRLSKANEQRSKSLPIVNTPRTSKRHQRPDADPLRYFAYLGKRFQFRERLPSAHNVFSAGPVILTSTSIISPRVSSNFRNQFQEIDSYDVPEPKYQGACQDFIDCCTCMCCVKAMFYHCTKDDDSEGEVSEHPCACSKPEPCCMVRWGILGMFTVCMPCLFLYLPIQGCKKAVDYLRRNDKSEFETL